MRVNFYACGVVCLHGARSLLPHAERWRTGKAIGAHGHQNPGLLICFERHASTVQQKIAARAMSHRDVLLCQQAQVSAVYLNSMYQKRSACEYPQPIEV